MTTKNVKLGVYSGLAGGVVFGVMMGMMGTLPMIGKMAGYPSAAFGFLVHMGISAVIGGSFGLVLGSRIRGFTGGVGYGLAYGSAWWLLGPLTLMPFFMGMGLGVNWSLEAASNMLPSLVGHLVFGAILGGSYGWVSSPACSSAGLAAETP